MTKIKRMLSVTLCFVVLMSLFTLSTWAAQYTSCRSGTVSWQMIYDNPQTYYWVDSEDEYCALTAVKSGKKYYVTLYRTKKGNETRYLKQEKDDDSSSAKEWDSASAVYTGGVLYRKNTSGGGTTDPQPTTTLTDGTYTATSTSSYKKDSETYRATVQVTVSNGKITALTATGPTASSDNKEYFSKALSGIRSQLVGQTAQYNSGSQVDVVSKATNSSKLIKEAIDLALAKASQSGEVTPTYTVTWRNSDGSLLETDKDVRAGSQPSYDGSLPVKASDTQYAYQFCGWATASGQTSGKAADTLPTVSGNVTYYAAFTKTVLVSVADGLYGDHTAIVQPFGYVPVVTVTVKDNRIVFLQADADTSDGNQEFLAEAVSGLQAKLVGQPVSAAIALDETADIISGATFASRAVIADIKSALAQSPKGNCVVVWQNADGETLKSDTVTYGSLTPVYSGTPTQQEDDGYTYTFKGWTPTASKFVTQSTAYTAVYTAVEKEKPVTVYADGKYMDATCYVAYGYTPRVTITVTDGKVAAVNVTAEDVGSNGYFLNTAKTWLQSQLEGKTADEHLLDGVDVVSGATASKRAVTEAVSKALQAENTIVWEDDSSRVLDRVTVSTGSLPVYDGTEPVKTNCHFVGWTPEPYAVTGDATYQAVFEAIQTEHTVAYDVLSEQQTYKAGETVTVTATIPTKDGYRFDGWQLDGVKLIGSSFVMPNHDVTLQAVWKEWYAEGVYGDDSVIDSLFGTYPITVAVLVNDSNQIAAITADTDEDTAVLEELGFYDALAYVEQELLYADISTDELERVYYASDPALGSDAPLFASDMVLAITEALHHEPKEPYQVTVQNTDGHTLAVYTGIAYGTRTDSVLATPEQPEDEQYRYHFVNWQDEPALFVKENAVYTAVFDKEEKQLQPLVNTSEVTAEEIRLGESLSIHASAQGGTGDYTYAVYYKKTSGTNWVNTPWSKETSLSIQPGAACAYDVSIRVRDSAGSVSEKNVSLRVVGRIENTSVLLSDTITVGETINVKASAVYGSGSYTYAVYYKKTTDTQWNSTKWKDSTNISVRPAEAALYDVCVKAKDTSGAVSKLYFKVTVNELLTNHSYLLTPSVKLGEEIKVQSAAAGGVGSYRYCLYYKKTIGTKWSSTAWGPVSGLSFKPAAATNYMLCVKVQDTKGTISKKYFEVTVER